MAGRQRRVREVGGLHRRGASRPTASGGIPRGEREARRGGECPRTQCARGNCGGACRPNSERSAAACRGPGGSCRTGGCGARAYGCGCARPAASGGSSQPRAGCGPRLAPGDGDSCRPHDSGRAGSHPRSGPAAHPCPDPGASSRAFSASCSCRRAPGRVDDRGAQAGTAPRGTYPGPAPDTWPAPWQQPLQPGRSSPGGSAPRQQPILGRLRDGSPESDRPPRGSGSGRSPAGRHGWPWWAAPQSRFDAASARSPVGASRPAQRSAARWPRPSRAWWRPGCASGWRLPPEHRRACWSAPSGGCRWRWWRSSWPWWPGRHRGCVRSARWSAREVSAVQAG